MRRATILTFALVLGVSPFLHAGTSLSKAAIAGDVPKLRACLEAGEKVNEIDKWGWTALMWAVYYRNMPATKFLLEHKADPNVQSTLAYGSFRKQSTPLLICAYYGLEEPTDLLLKAGADKQLADEKGKKPLDLAREFNFEPIVNLLTGKPAHVEPPPKPAPQPEPAVKSEPPASKAASGSPAPTKKATPAKRATPKKPSASPKSEPPAIK